MSTQTMAELCHKYPVLLCGLLATVQCLGIPRLEVNAELRRFIVMSGILPRSGVAAVETARGWLGPAGGDLATSDGVLKMSIPPGALADRREFSIRKYPVQLEEIPRPYAPASEAYEVFPPLRFRRAATLRLRSMRAAPDTVVETLAAAETTGFDNYISLGDWHEVPGQREGDWLVVRNRGFAFFMIGRRTTVANRRPRITAAGLFLHEQTDGSRVPAVLRARIQDPEGERLTVRLLAASVRRSHELRMIREGNSDWYRAVLPRRLYRPDGLNLRILARDESGNQRSFPRSRAFRYPLDARKRNFDDLY